MDDRKGRKARVALKTRNPLKSSVDWTSLFEKDIIQMKSISDPITKKQSKIFHPFRKYDSLLSTSPSEIT